MNFEVVYREHINELFSYGLALGIEYALLQDIIHDVFLHLFEHQTTLDSSRNIKFYLFRSLKNRFIDLVRKEAPVELIETQEEHAFTLSVTALDLIEEEEERKQITLQIEEILQTLTSRQREAIYLRFMQGLEYHEIAELLDLSPKGVRKLVYRSIDSIRRTYGVETTLLFLFLIEKSMPPLN